MSQFQSQSHVSTLARWRVQVNVSVPWSFSRALQHVKIVTWFQGKVGAHLYWELCRHEAKLCPQILLVWQKILSITTE